MKHTYCKEIHDPENGTWGDCSRACLASLLNLKIDQVPHFAENYSSDEDCLKKESDWLRTQGYMPFVSYFSGSLNDMLWTMSCINPGIYYMVTGNLENTPHSVIALNDMIVFDPSDKLIESMSMKPIEGRYWVKVLVPLIFAA